MIRVLVPARSRPLRLALRLSCISLALVGCATSSDSGRPNDEGTATTRPGVPTSTTTHPMNTEQILERTRTAVVRVRNNGCGELATGTAWLAPDGRLISNRHVVEAARTLDVLTWDGRDATATGALVSNSADIGVLEGRWASVAGLVPIPTRRERVEVGERITIVGYPEGDRLDASSGVAVGYGVEPEVGTVEVLRATNIVKPGNSGGPAVDQQGRVVGVVFAEYLPRDEALIVPWDVVASLPAGDLAGDQGCG